MRCSWLLPVIDRGSSCSALLPLAPLIGTLFLDALPFLALLALTAARFPTFLLPIGTLLNACTVLALLTAQTALAITAGSLPLGAPVATDVLQGIEADLVLGAAVAAAVGPIVETVLSTLSTNAGPVIGTANATAAKGLRCIATRDSICSGTARLASLTTGGVCTTAAAGLIPGAAPVATLRVRWQTAVAGIGGTWAGTASFTRVWWIRRLHAAFVHAQLVATATLVSTGKLVYVTGAITNKLLCVISPQATLDLNAACCRAADPPHWATALVGWDADFASVVCADLVVIRARNSPLEVEAELFVWVIAGTRKLGVFGRHATRTATLKTDETPVGARGVDAGGDAETGHNRAKGPAACSGLRKCSGEAIKALFVHGLLLQGFRANQRGPPVVCREQAEDTSVDLRISWQLVSACSP